MSKPRNEATSAALLFLNKAIFGQNNNTDASEDKDIAQVHKNERVLPNIEGFDLLGIEPINEVQVRTIRL